MQTDPFGRRRPGRWQRALIYFGLAEERDVETETSPPARPAERRAADPETRASPPPARSDPQGRAARKTGTAEPRAKEQSWQRSALLYLGLVEGEPQSRYGAELPSELDDDIDDLRRRVADLEEELRRRGPS